MPFKPRRVCSCGKVVWSGELCACQIKRKAENDRRRPNANDRGYDSRWSKARRAFLDKHPDCVMCGKPAVVVDHLSRTKATRSFSGIAAPTGSRSASITTTALSNRKSANDDR
ncbi:HNH endonuclease [Bradyrhizobium sp. Gha]|uniref:HNH endonuclease n=1 Tax=Bradyrhizobium sp. Gha TaxID=1855318 RepID=UPI0008F23B7D|nr:hypothetical protein SAMN05216525_14969 [Bradyrhizobium sp. Gha]